MKKQCNSRKENKKNPQDYNPIQMYEQGCAFLNCAVYTELEKSNIPCRTNAHMYADISLSAFACEIFIKCLIVLNNETYDNDHLLEELWKKYRALDEIEANKVEMSLKDWFKSDNPYMFDEMLTKASDAFKEWRYAYEYKNSGIEVNFQFLRGFRKDLCQLCYKKILAKKDANVTRDGSSC